MAGSLRVRKGLQGLVSPLGVGRGVEVGRGVGEGEGVGVSVGVGANVGIRVGVAGGRSVPVGLGVNVGVGGTSGDVVVGVLSTSLTQLASTKSPTSGTR